MIFTGKWRGVPGLGAASSASHNCRFALAVESYRLALFASVLGWEDVTRVERDRRTTSMATQPYRALGSIGANIADSRSLGLDRARFLEYALGSERESRDWYYKCRPILGDEVMLHRIGILTSIIRILLATLPRERRFNARY